MHKPKEERKNKTILLPYVFKESLEPERINFFGIKTSPCVLV